MYTYGSRDSTVSFIISIKKMRDYITNHGYYLVTCQNECLKTSVVYHEYLLYKHVHSQKYAIKQ
jgi:predicted nucleic acid-binding Zn finger protein